jgi:hypothetical protein
MFDLFGDEQRYSLDVHRTDGRGSETNKLTSIPDEKKARQTVEVDVGKVFLYYTRTFLYRFVCFHKL